MSRRKTACLLCPGPTRSELWQAGGIIARVTMGTDRSLCGRNADTGEIPEAEWPDVGATERPNKLCPRCWAVWKRDTMNHDKTDAEMDATCYLCFMAVQQAPGGHPNAHAECEAESDRLDLATELHAEDIPGTMACMDTLQAEWDVSQEYRAWRAARAKMEVEQ